jgi:hypothetical protein
MTTPLIAAEQAKALEAILDEAAAAAAGEWKEKMDIADPDGKGDAGSLIMTLTLHLGAATYRDKLTRLLLGDLNYALTREKK